MQFPAHLQQHFNLAAAQPMLFTLLPQLKCNPSTQRLIFMHIHRALLQTKFHSIFFPSRAHSIIRVLERMSCGSADLIITRPAYADECELKMYRNCRLAAGIIASPYICRASVYVVRACVFFSLQLF